MAALLTMPTDFSPTQGADAPRSGGSPRRRELTAEEYYAGVRAGDVAVLARALTLIESSSPRHQPLAATSCRGSSAGCSSWWT